MRGGEPHARIPLDTNTPTYSDAPQMLPTNSELLVIIATPCNGNVQQHYCTLAKDCDAMYVTCIHQYLARLQALVHSCQLHQR